jgi:hypothetical protein
LFGQGDPYLVIIRKRKYARITIWNLGWSQILSRRHGLKKKTETAHEELLLYMPPGPPCTADNSGNHWLSRTSGAFYKYPPLSVKEREKI